ncbi:hypothetical protein CAP37_16785 [Hydrogenophaga sp. IBVHS1]|nr:hypothetical protein CAP37_16785 [Hydrogenophaga sp. IBVHS1]
MGWIAGVVLAVLAAFLVYGNWKDRQLAAQRSATIDEWLEQRNTIGDLLNQFKDAAELADAVPASQMAPYVEKLQAVNRELYKTPLPPCLDSHAKLDATDSLISVYLTYMKDPSDRGTFLRSKNEATLALRQAINALTSECSTMNATLRVYREVK